MMWLNFSNAFGSVPHDTIFRALTLHGVRQKLINIIRTMYSEMSTTVHIRNGSTPPSSAHR